MNYVLIAPKDALLGDLKGVGEYLLGAAHNVRSRGSFDKARIRAELDDRQTRNFKRWLKRHKSEQHFTVEWSKEG